MSGAAIDLAEVADFAMGDLLVRPSLRRVNAGSIEESVEPRVMQALIALVQADGAVVSRDSLTDRCWGGRIVGEDAINRCIAKVRRLAETTQPAAFDIETVPKVGYRLQIRHRESTYGAKPSPSPFRPAGTVLEQSKRSVARARWWPIWIACGLTITAGSAAALWDLRLHAKWTVLSSRMLLQNVDGQTDPRLSPDGRLLAYAVVPQSGDGRIYARNLQGGTSIAMSAADDNAGSPAWASDSVHLAYAVAGRDGAPCRIMVTTFPGGTPSLAGRCRQANTTQIASQPGTPYLFLADKTPVLDGQFTTFFDSIFRLDTDTGRSEQVTSPPASEADYGARVSPDGTWLAYIRDRGFQGQAVRLRRLTSSEERELVCDPDVHSIDWTTDSRALIASVPGLMGGEIFAYPINGARGYRVYSSAASPGPLSTGPGGMLALEVDEGRTNLARASIVRRASTDLIDPAAGMTDWASFAPDGTLAFVSNRSGKIALWTRRPGGQPVELTGVDFKDIERPVWSPDGSRIAFFEVWKGDITVHVVKAHGESVVSFRVPSIGFGMPNWTPDGEHLVMFDKLILRAVQIDLRNPEHREPVADKLWDGVTYRDGAIYSVHGSKGGIWQLDGGPRLITPNYPVERHPRLAFKGNDILIPASRDGGDLRILAQPLTGGPSRVAYYAPAAEPESPISVDPVTGDVVYVSKLAVDSHIELLTLARQ